MPSGEGYECVYVGGGRGVEGEGEKGVDTYYRGGIRNYQLTESPNQDTFMN